MGCCLCRPTGGVYDAATGDDPSSSSRRIAPTSSSTRTSQSHSHSHHANEPPPADLATRNNKRLRPIPRDARAVISDPTRDPNAPAAPVSWTRARLLRERNDWWDTRVEGNRNIWDAYRACVDALQRGEVQNAQAILDAAGCTCPSGELWRRIFGPDGVEYSVSGSRWVVLEPVGVIDDEQATGAGAGRGGVEAGEGIPIVSMSRKTSRLDDEEDEEGIMPGSRPAAIKVKCRLSDSARDHVVQIPGDAVVADLVLKLRSELGYNDMNLSVAFMGKRFGPEAVVSDFYDEDKVVIIMVQPRT